MLNQDEKKVKTGGYSIFNQKSKAFNAFDEQKSKEIAIEYNRFFATLLNLHR